MGLSVAASSAILFVGFLLVATAMFTGLSSTLHEIEDAFKDAQQAGSDIARTSIRVENATNNTTHVFINITNSGSEPLKISEVQLLINGTLATDMISNRSVEGNNMTDIWAPEEVLYVEVAYATVTKPMRIMVITGAAVSDVEVLT